MIKLRDILFEQKMLTIYRGISVHNRDGNYFTTDPEWARQFTQSGQDKEILQVEINPAMIYKPFPLPHAVNEDEVNSAIETAKVKGFAAVWIDEGHQEPNSIFVFRKGKLRNVKRYVSHVNEAKKFDMTNLDDVVTHVIRRVWAQIPSSDDKFSEYDFFLWMDNDSDMSNSRINFAKQFFPNDDEETAIEKFDNEISRKLEELEAQSIKRKASKINQLDPLFILKSLVRGKTWEGAKQALFKNTLGSWFYKGGKISDEDAEGAFNRLYKNAMGETMYDMTKEKLYGRLSQIHRQQIDTNRTMYDHTETNKYSINMFIDQYVGRNATQFPNKVKVFRGVNNPTVPIRPGDFVTFDKDYAKSYVRGKYGSIIKDVLDSKDLFVYKVEPHGTELVYWPEGHKIKKYEGHIPTFREFWDEVNKW